MGEMRQKLLKEYWDISNVLKSLEPDEVHLQMLNVVLNYFPCEGQKQDKPSKRQVRTTQARSSVAREILSQIIPSKHQKENKDYKQPFWIGGNALEPDCFILWWRGKWCNC